MICSLFANITAGGEEIARLQERISAQEQALCTERQISSDLRNRIMSVKPLQSDEAQDLVNTVKSLHESISANTVDQAQQLELSESVCRRSANRAQFIIFVIDFGQTTKSRSTSEGPCKQCVQGDWH